MMTIVAQDCSLEDKMLTVCYGCDMVNVSYVNFAAIGRNVAKVTAICSCDSVDNNPSLLGVVHVMWKPHIGVETTHRCGNHT